MNLNQKKEQERKELVKQLGVLYAYQEKLLIALNYVNGAETTSVLQFKIAKLEVPALDDLRVFDREGRVIDWTEFPKEYKREPFRLFNGAVLESYKQWGVEVDFEFSTVFLNTILTYLHTQINRKIETLLKQLNG